MISVIINADDLGKNKQVNSEIAFALSKGFITSSSILANSIFWDDIHSIIDSNPTASFGIHLNLTEGFALTNSKVLKDYGIVDSDNKFTKKNLFFLKTCSITKELLDAIYDEWDKQLDKVVNVEGIAISHLDGHHHIHSYLALSEVLMRLIKKYNIKILRRRYTYPQSKCYSIFESILKLFPDRSLFSFFSIVFNSHSRLGAFLRTRIETILWNRKFYSYLKSDYFDSYEHFFDRLIIDNIGDNSVVELMCHPGNVNYHEEFLMIKGQKLNARLKFSLVSYSSIH